MVDLGVAPFEAGEGRVATRIELAPRHLQHTGVVHAGLIGALADHTMGAAAQTMAPAGHWVLTAEFKVSLLRAGRGQRIECVATVVKPGRQISFTEAQVFALTAPRARWWPPPVPRWPSSRPTEAMRATVDFLLHDWLGVESLTARPRFAEHSRETFASVLDTCERIAREKYAPFNASWTPRSRVS